MKKRRNSHEFRYDLNLRFAIFVASLWVDRGPPIRITSCGRGSFSFARSRYGGIANIACCLSGHAMEIF
jgi:hypothetical protein